MALSARTRRRRTNEAQKLIGNNETIQGYAQVVAGPNPNDTVLKVGAGAVGTAVVMFLLLHTVVLPGYLLFIFAYWTFNPPRALAVTDNHVVLFKRSKFNAKPVEILGTFDRDVLVQAAPDRFTRLPLGDEDVWATRAEYAALTAR